MNRILFYSVMALPVIPFTIYFSMFPYWTHTTMYSLEECMPKGADVRHYTSANCGIECDYYLGRTPYCYHKWVPL